MAAPNHVDHQPAPGESSSDSQRLPAATIQLYRQMIVTRLALGMPMTAARPNQVDQPLATAAAAAVEASVSAATPGHCPGGIASDGDELALTLTKSFATTTLDKAAAVANNKAAPDVFVSPSIRASQDTPAAVAAKPAGSRAELWARRRPRLHLIRVPMDYLRARQESRDRSRMRELVRRWVGRLLSIHEDRARKRGISAMMARLTTTLESASGSGGVATVSAPTPSPEHAGLADLLEKMALWKKH